MNTSFAADVDDHLPLKKSKSIRLERTMPSLVAVTSSPGFVLSRGFNSSTTSGPGTQTGMELLFDESTTKSVRQASVHMSSPTMVSISSPRGAIGAALTHSSLAHQAVTMGSVAAGAVPLRFTELKAYDDSTATKERKVPEDSEESEESDEESGRANSQRASKAINVGEEGVPPITAAARAEESLLRQQAERLQLSAHYQRLRQGMRPPPPITLADLEKHPLKNSSTKKRPANEELVQNELAGATEASEESDDDEPRGREIPNALSKAHLETFAPKTRSIEVKRLLLNELTGAEASARQQKSARALGGARGGSDYEQYAQLVGIPTEMRTRFPALTHSGRYAPQSGQLTLESAKNGGPTQTGDLKSTFFVTDVTLTNTRPDNNKPTEANGKVSRHASLNKVVPQPPPTANYTTSSLPSTALSIRRFGPDKDEKILNRNPIEFRNHEGKQRHAQHYRQIASATVGPPPKPATAGEDGVVANSEDVKDFLFSLFNRNSKFNDSTINELQRVRAAQKVFFEAKKNEIERILESAGNIATPAEKLMIDVRKKIETMALNKDIGERLDIYFDHLERLERFCMPKFPNETDRRLFSTFISKVRADVEGCEASLHVQDFVMAWKHYKSLFGYESLLEVHKVEMLKLLSSMYGVTREQFRTWLHKKLRRYEPKDFNAVFRHEDLKLGRDISNNRKVRFTIHGGKSLMPNDGGAYQNIFIRVIAESNIYSTAAKPLTSNKITWDKQFNLTLIDDKSPIRVQVVIDEATAGEQTLQVSQFAVGAPITTQLDIKGPLIPFAKVDVELLLVHAAKDQPSFMNSTVTQQQQANKNKRVNIVSPPSTLSSPSKNKVTENKSPSAPVPLNPFSGHEQKVAAVTNSPRKDKLSLSTSPRKPQVGSRTDGARSEGERSTPSLYLSSSVALSAGIDGDEESDNEI